MLRDALNLGPAPTMREGDRDMERARDPPGTPVNPVSPGFCLKTSEEAVGETQLWTLLAAEWRPREWQGSRETETAILVPPAVGVDLPPSPTVPTWARSPTGVINQIIGFFLEQIASA